MVWETGLPDMWNMFIQVLFGISGKDKISLMTVSCILGRMIYLALTDDAKFVFLFVEIKDRPSL